MVASRKERRYRCVFCRKRTFATKAALCVHYRLAHTNLPMRATINAAHDVENNEY